MGTDNSALLALTAAVRQRVEQHERLHRAASYVYYFDDKSCQYVIKDGNGDETRFDTEEEANTYCKELREAPLSLVTTRDEMIKILEKPTGQVTLASPPKPGDLLRIEYQSSRPCVAPEPEVKPAEIPPPSGPDMRDCYPRDVAVAWAHGCGYEVVRHKKLGGTDESYTLYRSRVDGHGYVTVQHGNNMTKMDLAHWRWALKVLDLPPDWRSGDQVPSRMDRFPWWIRVLSYGVAYTWVGLTWPWRWFRRL